MPARALVVVLLVALSCAPAAAMSGQLGPVMVSSPQPARTGEQMAEQMWEHYTRTLGPERLAQASIEVRPTSTGWMAIIHDINATCRELQLISCRGEVYRDVFTCTSGVTLGASPNPVGPDEYLGCGGPPGSTPPPPLEQSEAGPRIAPPVEPCRHGEPSTGPFPSPYGC